MNQALTEIHPIIPCLNLPPQQQTNATVSSEQVRSVPVS